MSRPLASSARRLPLARPPRNGPSRAVRAGSTGASSAPRTGRRRVTHHRPEAAWGLLVAAEPSSRPPSSLPGGCPKPASAARRARPSRSAFQRVGRGPRALAQRKEHVQPPCAVQPRRRSAGRGRCPRGPRARAPRGEGSRARRSTTGVPVQGVAARCGGCWAVSGRSTFRRLTFRAQAPGQVG